MNKYNVFDKIFHYKSFLYWKNLKRLPRQLKWAKQRVTKGYCRSDWYDMDSWFAHVVADMFDEYAENTCSHPWEINNPDDWKDILKEMATHLRNAGIEEIAEERYSHMADSKAKIREQNKWRKEELHKFCELFEKYYFDLWD